MIYISTFIDKQITAGNLILHILYHFVGQYCSCVVYSPQCAQVFMMCLHDIAVLVLGRLQKQ